MLAPVDVAALVGAGLLSGALNVLGGGGSFITFPTLVALGIPPVLANSTNTVGIWPASLAGAVSQGPELASQKHLLRQLGFVSLVGGLVGAWLLLAIPSRAFTRLLPWLMGVATVLFAFGKQLTARLRQGRPPAEKLGLASFVVQFVIAVYGGFYGGGMGIMMMAGLALAGMEDVLVMNALKNLLSGLVNGIAVVYFAIVGAVAWPQALVLAVGAIAGGYLAGRFARKLAPRWIRAGVIVIGTLLTIVFAIR